MPPLMQEIETQGQMVPNHQVPHISGALTAHPDMVLPDQACSDGGEVGVLLLICCGAVLQWQRGGECIGFNLWCGGRWLAFYRAHHINQHWSAGRRLMFHNDVMVSSSLGLRLNDLSL